MKHHPINRTPLALVVATTSVCGTFPILGATEFWSETFETNGHGSRYTASSEFYDTTQDYSTRVQDSNGNAIGGETPPIDLDADDVGGQDASYTAFEGQWYYAWEDVDDTGGSGADGEDFKVIDFNAINTGGHENLVFQGLFAAGDTDSNPSYDSDSFVAVLYSQDGGTTWTPGIVIRGDATNADASNHPARVVNTLTAVGGFNLGNELANNHRVVTTTGIGNTFTIMEADTPSNNSAADGALLTTAFQELTFSIPNGASTLIRFVVHADDGNAEIAIDNFRLCGDEVIINNPPVANSISAADVGEPEIGETSYSFTVTYSDDTAVDASTIDASDVTVNGIAMTSGSTTDPSGPSVTATYTFTPPGGSWDDADNGTYTVNVVANQVGDDGGPQLFAAAGAVGTFDVAATNTPPVMGTIVAADVTASDFGQSSYSFAVEYTDIGGLDASSIGADDITVTGPGGAVAVTSGTTSDPDGTTVTAIYTVTPPGGSWDNADDGTYTIGIVGGQVLDVVGASVPANASAATFSVDSGLVFCETFTTDGIGSRYTVSGGSEFYTGEQDYFTRVRDINGNAAGGETPAINLDGDTEDEYDDFNGEWYYAGEDFVGGDFRVMDFTPINTAAHSGLSFAGLFGAGDTDAGPAYDSDSFLAILYSIDGGTTYLPGLVFRGNVNSSDDTDFPFAQVNTITPSGLNGINTLADLGATLSAGSIVVSTGAGSNFSYMAADGGGTAASGTVLSHALQQFGFAIPGSPAEVRLRLVMHSDSANVEMAFDHLKLSGSFVGPNTAPALIGATAADVGEPEIGDASYSFTVQYGDDSAIAASTIDLNDVIVTGPGGPVTVTAGTTSDPDGTPLTATYTITPPGGDWDAADNGTYTIEIAANEVGDDGGTQLFVASGAAGSFEVNATNNDPVVNGFVANDVIVPNFGETSYSFTVTYTDGGEISASSISGSNVTVTGPGGPIPVTGGSTSDPDGSTVTATYTITPPGGSWDEPDAGIYTIAVLDSQVADELGAFVAADPGLATFEVHTNKVLNENFEDDGAGTRYTVNGGAANEFFNGSGGTDYFTRVFDNGSGPNPAILLDADPAGTNYTGFDGLSYFAAEDVDFDGRPGFRVVDLAPTDTTGFTAIEFAGLFAAGDTDANPSYDSDHFMAVLYSIDGGTTYLPGLVFRANGNAIDASNFPLAQVDTIAPSGSNGIVTLADLGAQISTGAIVPSTAAADNFGFIASDDGTNAAVGTALTTTFAPFTFPIPDASEVRLRLVLHADGQNVEMAFDSLMVTGTHSDLTFPIADLADPLNGDSLGAGAINLQGYLDVTFTDTDSGLDVASVTDVGNEIALTGTAAAGVVVNGSPTLVSGTTYRYTFTGEFEPGVVGVTFVDSSFADIAGNPNTVEMESFTVTNTAPVADTDTVERHPTSSLKIPIATLLDGDSDPDGHSLSVTAVTASGSGATVTISGTQVLYDPKGLLTADTFTYTLEDSFGATTTGTVNVNLVNLDGQVGNGANLTGMETLGDGSVKSNFAGIPGRTYRIQSSDTLAPGNWVDRATVTADALGMFSFTDPPPLPATRFYRTLQP